MVSRKAIKETYDQISPHFAQTRPHPWQDVSAFLENRSGNIGLDLGIGNGRHAQLLATRVTCVIGIDISRVALEGALNRSEVEGFKLSPVMADAAEIPLRNDSIDLLTYIATLHHLPSRKLRIQSLNEVARILSTSGRGIISVWSTTHPSFNRAEGFDTYLDWTLPDGTTVPRFYHVYDPYEFEDELKESNLTVHKLFTSHGNCYAII